MNSNICTRKLTGQCKYANRIFILIVARNKNEK